MAPVSKNPITSIFSLKNLLLSISVVALAFILKPYVFEVFVSGVPALRSWFTPPYLYVVVNFIIIAIAASSRFQQKMEVGVSGLVASAKVQQTDIHKETYDLVGRKNSAEYKTDFGMIQPEMYGHVDVKVQAVQFKPRIETGENKYVEAKVSVVQIKRKPVEPKRELAVKIKVQPVEPKRELESFKPKKFGNIEAKNLKVNNLIEKSAKESEDGYTRSKSVEMPNRTATIEIAMDYSPEARHISDISDRSDHEEHKEEIHQAGKEVGEAEGAEENDTLEGTWKMIMESRRIHVAALQAESEKSYNARSPSHSSKKEVDTYNC